MKLSLTIIILSIFLNNCSVQKFDFKDTNFKNAILEQVDSNKNGKLDDNEINETTKLKLDEKNIYDISGIEIFKNLTNLNLRKNNISNFDKLNSLTNLEELVIGDNNKIENLNLINLQKLKGLYAFRLGIKNIKLNSKLIENLYLQDNFFQIFETKNFPELYTLNLDGCKNLKELDLKKNKKLVQLYLLNTAIENLNVSENTILKTMYVESNVKIIKNSNQEQLKSAPIIIQN